MTYSEAKHIIEMLTPKYPNWYGIEEIKFIWHNEWSDPEIEYKGKRCNCYAVENTMWGYINEEYPNKTEEELLDMFPQYMRDNTEEVVYLTELELGLIEY